VTEPVLVRVEPGVALITLNLPGSRNALSVELVNSIGAVFNELENDGATKSVVITGAGRAFCAGAELATLRNAADGHFEPIKIVYDAFLRVLHSPLATIAAINGPAVGAGLNLALACDVRLAGPRAVFDTRFAELKIHPGGGHVWMLERAVGKQQAVLACLFGSTWNCDEALARGLVAAVHPDDELVSAALELAHRLDRQDVAYTRRLVQTLRSSFETVSHADALQAETEAQQWSTTLPAFRDGVEDITQRVAAASRAQAKSG
jgi:enoyl-CoA hydratase